MSLNLGANLAICLLAVRAGSADCEEGFPPLRRFLADAGVDVNSMALADGRGGDPVDRANPSAVTQILRYWTRRPAFDRWRTSLPILGVDGSLASNAVDSPARGKVFAKTGTAAGGDPLSGTIQVQAKALAGISSALTGPGSSSMSWSTTEATVPTSVPCWPPAKTSPRLPPSCGRRRRSDDRPLLWRRRRRGRWSGLTKASSAERPTGASARADSPPPSWCLPQCPARRMRISNRRFIDEECMLRIELVGAPGLVAATNLLSATSGARGDLRRQVHVVRLVVGADDDDATVGPFIERKLHHRRRD